MRIPQVVSDLNPAFSSFKFHGVFDFASQAPFPTQSPGPLSSKCVHAATSYYFRGGLSITGLVLRGTKKSFVEQNKAPSPSDCISLFTSDKSGVLTAQVTTVIPGPHGAGTAKEESHGLGARKPEF